MSDNKQRKNTGVLFIKVPQPEPGAGLPVKRGDVTCECACGKLTKYRVAVFAKTDRLNKPFEALDLTPEIPS